MNGFADLLNLPGRGVVSAVSTPSRDGAQKTPTRAPSGELLRMVGDALRNDGPFDDRAVWVMLGHAIKGAAVAGGCEAVGREVWLGLSGRWHLGGDPAEAERVWDSIHDPHVGWGYLLRTLERVDPAAYRRIKAEEAKLRFTQEAARNVQVLSSTKISPVVPFVPGQISPRQWLYGQSTIRGFLSLLVAPGGAGKSALMMAEAVAMATGRELLPGEKPTRPLRVWYHNAEDSLDEQKRRLAAAMIHHGVLHADLGGRLFLTGRDLLLLLARTGREGPESAPSVVDFIVETALAHGIDVIVLDPLGAMHTLPENDNAAMNVLAGALREIAERAGVAVVVLHHTSKAAAGDMAAAGAGASRGASALVDAARDVRQLIRMTPQVGVRLGVPEDQCCNFVRVENGKANLSRADDARWRRLVSVNLGNGTSDYPHGDNVAAVERWVPPALAPSTAADLAAVHRAILAAPSLPRLDPKAINWIGWLVARTLGLDAGEMLPAKTRNAGQAAAFARVKRLVENWLADGSLVRRDERDPGTRQIRVCVAPGTGQAT